MRIRLERIEDPEENLDCTTRRQPIRRLRFMPRPADCGYRFRRQPFTPIVSLHPSDEWPFFLTSNNPEPETKALVEDIDLDKNPHHSRRQNYAQILGEAIVVQLNSRSDESSDSICAPSAS